MSGMANQYDIARSTGHCAISGTPLAPGEPYMAVLVERSEDEGLERQDYSMAAWEGGARPPRLYSYWRSIVPSPNEKRRMFVDDSLLMDLFERLGSDTQPQRQAFRFVLGLVLLRKRLLRHVGRAVVEGPSGPVEQWTLERRVPAGVDSGPQVELVNPRLTDEDVRTISDQLGEILQGDLA